MTIDTVRAAIASLGIEPETVVPTAGLREDLGLDSTELVEVSLDLAARLGTDARFDLSGEMTVTDVCRIVDATVAAAGPAGA